MMTRVVSWLFFASLAVIVLLLVLPGFIDWTRHKDLMVNEISARLGQEIRIGGEVSLSLLPNPHVRLEDVVIGPEGKDRYLAALKTLDARMSFSELLHGRFEIEEIHISEPVINIVDGDKGSNWSVFLEDIRRNSAAEETGKETMIGLRQMTVSRAHIIYRTAQGAPKWELPQINMSMAGTSLSGPYDLRGDFMYGQEPVTFTLKTAARSADGSIPFEMLLMPVDTLPSIDLKGMISPLAPDVITAAVSTQGGALRHLLQPFPAYFTAFDTIPAINDPTAAATFDLALSASQTALRNIAATQGQKGTLAGDVIFRHGKTEVDADITVTGNGYWLSFKGIADIAQRVFKGDVMLKAESLAQWSPGLPDVSAEVAGLMTQSAATAWSLSNMSLSLVEWTGIDLKGRAQRNGPDITFTVAGLSGDTLADLTLEGKAAKDSFDAAGKASLYGKPITVVLSGSGNKPDLGVVLDTLPPQVLLNKLDLSSPLLTWEAGASTFIGHLDFAAVDAGAAVEGKLSLSPSHLRITDFNPEALAEKTRALTKVPTDLEAQLLKAIKTESGRFKAQPLHFDFPLTKKSWEMKNLAYTGGSFDLQRDNDGGLKVSVNAGSEGMPGYTATLPISQKDLPTDDIADLIRLRHPEPKIDTKETIGDILERLNELDASQMPPEDHPLTDDPVDIFKAVPPVAEDTMPPQPQPALPEMDVAPPPTLPADTPLADELKQDAPVAPPPSGEIFPFEENNAAP